MYLRQAKISYFIKLKLPDYSYNSTRKGNKILMMIVTIIVIVAFRRSIIIEPITLKAPNKNCSRRYFNFLLLFFEENKTWPRGYKTFFVLNSVEHEI